MGGHEARDYWEHWGLVFLWVALLSGPVAWFFDQGLSYIVVKPVCASGGANLLTVITLVALAIVAAGGWTGWRCLAQLRGATEDGPRLVDRSYFMAVMGISLNALIALLIVTAGISRYMLSPCE
jgi:hypothetical protein